MNDYKSVSGNFIPSKVIQSQVESLLEWNRKHINKPRYIAQIRENIRLIDNLYYRNN